MLSKDPVKNTDSTGKIFACCFSEHPAASWADCPAWRFMEWVRPLGAEGGLSGGGINENRADFYVTPNGDAVPSMEYRYMPRNADHMPSLRNTMEIPANIKDT